MKREDLYKLSKIRLIIGYLGELEQKSWWNSSFFSTSSSAFLNPVFGKTLALAKYNGVKEAASMVHDDHIGIGKGTYHLFRLPESMEKDLHEIINSEETIDFISRMDNPYYCLDTLKNFADDLKSDSIGPVRVGKTSDVSDISIWNTVAKIYFNAFQNNSKIFPFFSEV